MTDIAVNVLPENTSVFAANEPGPTYGPAHDFLERRRVIAIPSPAERAADIPTIFDTVLRNMAAARGVDVVPMFEAIGGDHYEALCLDGFPVDNVRGLIDIADRLVTRMRTGAAVEEALLAVFREGFFDGPVAKRSLADASEVSGASAYEQNKDAIIAAFRESGGNLSAAERLLKQWGSIMYASLASRVHTEMGNTGVGEGDGSAIAYNVRPMLRR